jgi:hypothetical protein
MADFLTEFMSAEPGVQVFDRAGLDAVADEQALDVTLARLDLRGADGVVFVDRVPGGPHRFRLAESGGAVVAVYTAPEGAEVSPDWARVAWSRLRGAALNLGDRADGSIRVALQGFRAPGESQAGLGEEGRRLRKLVFARLAAEPGVLVLEREDLRDLALEHDFGAESFAGFWKSALLLDGVLEPAGDDVRIRMRLRKHELDSGRSVEIVVKAGDWTDATERIVREVGGAKGEEGGATETVREAASYFREAMWAYSVQAYDAAADAAEASWYLGGRVNEDALSLAIRCHARLAASPSPSPTTDEGSAVPLAHARLALQFLDDHASRFGFDPEKHAIVLDQATRPLERAWQRRAGGAGQTGPEPGERVVRNLAMELLELGLDALPEVNRSGVVGTLPHRYQQRPYLQWIRTVSQNIGWWQESEDAARILEGNVNRHLWFTVSPVRQSPFVPVLVPLGTSVTLPGPEGIDREASRWKELADRFLASADPHLRLKGAMIWADLVWWARDCPADLVHGGGPGNDRSWASRRTPLQRAWAGQWDGAHGQIIDLLRRHEDDLVADGRFTYCFGHLKRGGLLSEESVAVFGAWFRRTAADVSELSDWIFVPQSSSSSGTVGRPFSPDAARALVPAYLDYRNRMTGTFPDRIGDGTAAGFEANVIRELRKRGWVEPETVPRLPAGRMHLGEPIVLHGPQLDLIYQGPGKTTGLLVSDDFSSGYGHSADIAWEKPEGLPASLRLRLRRVDLATGRREIMDVDLPCDPDGALSAFPPQLNGLKVEGDQWFLLLLLSKREVGWDQVLVTVKAVTLSPETEIRVFEGSTGSILRAGADGVIVQLADISPVSEGDGRKVLMEGRRRIVHVAPARGEPSVWADSSRRPAETFLDDRFPVSCTHLLDDPERGPVFHIAFPLKGGFAGEWGASYGGGGVTSLMCWNAEEGDWELWNEHEIPVSVERVVGVSDPGSGGVLVSGGSSLWRIQREASLPLVALSRQATYPQPPRSRGGLGILMDQRAVRHSQAVDRQGSLTWLTGEAPEGLVLRALRPSLGPGFLDVHLELGLPVGFTPEMMHDLRWSVRRLGEEDLGLVGEPMIGRALKTPPPYMTPQASGRGRWLWRIPGPALEARLRALHETRDALSPAEGMNAAEVALALEEAARADELSRGIADQTITAPPQGHDAASRFGPLARTLASQAAAAGNVPLLRSLAEGPLPIDRLATLRSAIQSGSADSVRFLLESQMTWPGNQLLFDAVSGPDRDIEAAVRAAFRRLGGDDSTEALLEMARREGHLPAFQALRRRAP